MGNPLIFSECPNLDFVIPAPKLMPSATRPKPFEDSHRSPQVPKTIFRRRWPRQPIISDYQGQGRIKGGDGMKVRQRLFPGIGVIGLGLLALVWQPGLTTPRSWAAEKPAAGAAAQRAPLEIKVPWGT